jgi:hypothetical protein
MSHPINDEYIVQINHYCLIFENNVFQKLYLKPILSYDSESWTTKRQTKQLSVGKENMYFLE